MSPTVAFIWERARRNWARSWGPRDADARAYPRRAPGSARAGRLLRGGALRGRALSALLGGRFAFPPCARRSEARGAVERCDRPLQVVGDRVQLGKRVVVAQQAEAEVA